MRWLFAAALHLLVPAAVAADDRPPAARDERLAAIIAAVRAEEVKYKDIEYVARITVRDLQRKDPANPAEVTTMAKSRVVLQGERIFFRHHAFERVGASKYRHEEVSAFDGERTRTVVAGNCANIHLGRWQHPAISPAHSLPLAYDRVNFPLSTYLGGTEAIHARLGYTSEIIDSGSRDVFRRVEVRFDGEEVIDGLRCVKLRVDRWYQPNTLPTTQHLWLAPERNFLCIKGGSPRTEMHVEELREVAPGVWFPARIVVVLSNARNPKVKGVVLRRTETIVEDVNLAPRHEAAFFRGVEIPPGLPVFTIKDRRIVGSTLPEPIDDDSGRTRLAELAARVAEREKRYDNIEVKACATWTYPRSSVPRQNVRIGQRSEERSIVRGGLSYYVAYQKSAGADGWHDAGFRVSAYDGRWTRIASGQDLSRPEDIAVILRKGSMSYDAGSYQGIPVHRAHSLVLRSWAIFSTLSDLLASSPSDPGKAGTIRFRYCGAAEVDGHPCIEVRADRPGRNGQGTSFVLYLATDRNDIPIRLDHFGNPGQRQFPTAISRCDDFREIAPGLWYPFRLTEVGIDWLSAIVEGWVVLSWRRDTTIESVTLAPRVGDAVFHDVTIPAGSTVQVWDEAGRFVAYVQQAEAGVPSLELKPYLELVLASRGNVQNLAEQQARQKAINALIGKPAPAFAPGTTWLTGDPPTWRALRGKVVVLAFWAEWNDAGRDELMRVNQLHRDRAKSGLTVVGVHPPGSEPAEVRKVIDALHLEFPVGVGVPATEGANAWGELFDRFAVRSIPRVVVVDGEGKVVDHGRLEDVLARNKVLLEKGR
jgi:peroxiredoxin